MSSSDVFGGASRYSQYHDAAPAEGQDEQLAEDGEQLNEPAEVPASPDHDAPVRAEEPEVEQPTVSPLPPAKDPQTPAPVEEAPAQPTGAGPFSGEVVTGVDAEVLREATQSRSTWKAFLAKLGISTGPSKAELETRRAQQAADETTIRQQTWTRAVNIGVVSAKGGWDCCTDR